MFGALLYLAVTMGMPDALSTNERYIDCLNVIEVDVDTGRRIAQQWAATDNGIDAEHCLAVADLAAGYYILAGLRLDELAKRQIARDAGMSVELYRQAADAWVFAKKFEHAISSCESGLLIEPNSGELSLLCARAHSELGHWNEVIVAISTAENLGHVSSAGFVQRGRAQTKLGDYAAGADDVVRALSIDPMNIDALVLRGEIQQAGVEIEVYYSKDPITEE